MKFDTTSEADPKRDFDNYINSLDKKNAKYTIEEKREEPDGSLIVKIKKQYNAYGTEGYLE